MRRSTSEPTALVSHTRPALPLAAPLGKSNAEALVKYSRLKPEDEGNREKIAEAVEALVDQFTEGRLVPARDG